MVEVDSLTGGAGEDLFILGEQDQVYYNDYNSLTDGTWDYGNILDFDVNEDLIQLAGSSWDYTLGTSSDDSSTEIWHQSSELIAVLDGVVVSDFSEGFIFV